MVQDCIGRFRWIIADGRMRWSEAAFSILGYGAGVNPSIDLIIARIYPEDVPVFGRTIADALAGRLTIDTQHRVLTPTGVLRHVRLLGVPSSDGRAPSQYFGLIMNITASRQRGVDAVSSPGIAEALERARQDASLWMES